MIKRAERNGTANRFYGLVAGCVVLSLLLFRGRLVLTWQSTLAMARDDLRRSLTVAVEQATRVLDTDVLMAGRVNDLLGGLDDAAVIANEAELRDRILLMIQPLPHIGGVVVIGADGRPLLATQRFPAERSVDLTDQDYFKALRDQATPFALGRAVPGRLSNQPGAIVAVRRGADGTRFHGVIAVSVAPRYFEALDMALSNGDTEHAAGLYREDGAPLAFYATRAPFMELQPPTLPLSAIAAAPDTGIVRVSDTPDGVDRMIAYRRLDTYPVYATVARTWSSILSGWWWEMARHLSFGVPAALALIGMGAFAARRAVREGKALVELRTEVQRREIAETALRQAQKMEAIGRLTGGIAHDFNNHLTVINSNLELLQRRLSTNNGSLGHLVDAAMQGVQRAAALTHRLLAFSRKQPLEPESLDAGRLIGGMLDLLRRTLGEIIVIRAEMADGLWLTRVDANQFENALLNIAVNARDAMPDGGVLTISAANVRLDERDAAEQSDVAPGAYVRISVSDIGVGMRPDVADKAFEPFFTTKPLGRGTGMGLAMVYAFVRQSGGHVQLVSEPGTGSMVSLFLPRFDYAPAAVPAVAGVKANPMAANRETILVVEDDEVLRRTAAEGLREMGYAVLEAPDAMEAFRLIVDRGGIDLLFTDIGLPGGVSGRALAHAARNVSGSLKVLFTTGYAQRVDGSVRESDGPVLAKPFDLRELGAKVREALNGPAATDVVRLPAAQQA